MALKLMYPSVLKIPKKSGGAFRALNPILGSVVLMMLAVIPIVVFCLYRTWQLSILPAPYDLVYTILTTLLFAVVLVVSHIVVPVGEHNG